MNYRTVVNPVALAMVAFAITIGAAMVMGASLARAQSTNAPAKPNSPSPSQMPASPTGSSPMPNEAGKLSDPASGRSGGPATDIDDTTGKPKRASKPDRPVEPPKSPPSPRPSTDEEARRSATTKPYVSK